MNEKEKKRLMKRRKKEARYVRKTVITSLILALILALIAAGVYLAAPSFLQSEIDFALEKRNFERALKIAGYLGDDCVLLTDRRITYIQAEELLSAARYDEAQERFRSLGDYEDAPVRVQEAGYLKAESAYLAGDYENAIRLYTLVSGYADSVYKINKSRYILAEAALANGEYNDAMARFEALGSFEDAAQRRVAIAIDITGIEDGDQALLAASGLTDEELDRLNRLNERREMLRPGVLAVGNNHTCAVDAQGNVHAAGDNTYGQTNVSGWKNAVKVDCGARHTVALLADGTAVATGDNTHGQLNVGSWTDIVDIAAGAFDTYALTSDGRVLHAGYSDSSSVTGWNGITQISAGSYAACALYGSGMMLSTDDECLLADASGLVMADVNTAFGIGLSKSGQVYATFGNTGMENCVYISASGAGVLAIDMDGNVLSHFFRNTDNFDFEGLSAVSVAAGGSHHAVLLSDGTVRVFGDNSHGQADTSSWKLF